MPDVLGVTGHRPKKLGEYNKVIPILTTLATHVLIELKPTKVVSGMALGWDTAIVKGCIDLGIPFVAAVPFFGQEQLWPIKDQMDYQYYLDKADDIMILSDRYSDEAMQFRNEYVVDQSNKIAALWSGKPSGTANCLRYARQKNVPYQNFYERFKEMYYGTV
jgi:uncharacterized phage-like protein YoqJ